MWACPQAIPQPLSRVAARVHGPRGHAAAQVRAVMAFRLGSGVVIIPPAGIFIRARYQQR